MEHVEVKTKKSKNVVEPLKRPADDSIGIPELTSPKLKKKKVSIGSVGETDFIPRLSLDVSQLPEDLPPPNANSTHFDLTKNLSLSVKAEKKKKKMNDPDLTAIREESADGSKVNSRLTEKSQQLNEEKSKKKAKNVNQDSSSVTEGAPTVKTPKKKSSKEEKQDELTIPLPKSPKKNLKTAEASSSQVVDSVPVKDKKSKTNKNINASVQFNAELENDIEKNLLSPSKGKKKSKEDKGESSAHKEKKKTKEEKLTTSPTKEKKKSKDKFDSSPAKEKTKDIASCSVMSDDYIPPGQKSFKASPKKHSGDCPWKEESLSVSLANTPGIEYFAASSSMIDAELSSRRSGRQVPLMYGSLEGKIPPPPESPVKSSVSTKVESDSDSNPLPPKKLVISSKSQDSSDSSDSDSDQAAAPSKSTQKPRYDDSDDSDSDTAAQNRLLVSMGVMQSPLKTAKPIVKPDSSDSESEESSDEGKSAKVGANKNYLNAKSQKPILAAQAKSKLDVSRSQSSKKAFKTNTANQNVLNSSQLNQTKGQDSDSEDDLEAMKAALLKIEENKHSKVKPSKKKQSKLNSDSLDALTKKTEKKSNSKTMVKVSQNSSKVNSTLSKPCEESDSDSELIKSASMKVSALPKATQGKKSKPVNQEEPSKKSKAASVSKTKPSDNISSISQATKDNKNKPEIDDSDDEDEDIRVAIQNLVNKKSGKTEAPSKKVKATPAKKTKQKPIDSKIKSEIDDSDDDDAIKAAIQKVVNNTHEKQDASSKKTKAAPVKKSKLKANISSVPLTSGDSKNKAEIDDSDDDEGMRAVVKNLVNKKAEKAEVPSKKVKAANAKINKQKPSDSKNKPENDDSDDDNEAIRAAIQKVVNNSPEKHDVPSKKVKAVAVKKTKKQQLSDLKNNAEIDDSDEDEAVRNVMQKFKEPGAKEKQKRGTSKPVNVTSPSKKLPEKSQPVPVKKSSLSPVKNCSSVSYDSDSGPDDKNTTDTMEEMRQQRVAGGSKAKAAKSVKSQKISAKAEPKKAKSSKANTSSKIALVEDSISEKKQKPKNKKKASADEEISDVMQRLLAQAKLSVGL